MTKKTNDLKKGDRVLLANGEQFGDLANCGTYERYLKMKNTTSFKPWEAVIADNKKGNTRIATVEGFFTETGSIYSHEIMAWKDENGDWQPIEHTKEQLQLERSIEGIL